MTMMSMRDIVPWPHSESRVPTAFRGEMASPFAALQQEVNRLFDEAFGSFGMPAARFGFGVGWPNTEIAETEKEIRASFEVPSVEEKNIEVLLDGGDLIVRGEIHRDLSGEICGGVGPSRRRALSRQRLACGGDDLEGVTKEGGSGVSPLNRPRAAASLRPDHRRPPPLLRRADIERLLSGPRPGGAAVETPRDSD